MKPALKEVKLSLSFRSVCYNCKQPLDFNDRKYSDPGNSFGYYCEKCKREMGR